MREEVIYLKVKLRKEGNVPRSELHQPAGSACNAAEPCNRRYARRYERRSARHVGAWAVRQREWRFGRNPGRHDGGIRRRIPGQHAEQYVHASATACQRRNPRRHRRSTSGCRTSSARTPRRSRIASRRRRMVDLLRGRRGADSRRLGDARRGQLGRPGDAHRPQGQHDGRLRPGDGQRPQLSDARHGDAGDRERRHQG